MSFPGTRDGGSLVLLQPRMQLLSRAGTGEVIGVSQLLLDMEDATFEQGAPFDRETTADGSRQD